MLHELRSRGGRRRRGGRRGAGPAGRRGRGRPAAGRRRQRRRTSGSRSACATSTRPVAVAADGAWTGASRPRWRYAGDSGTEPARAEVTVRFVPRRRRRGRPSPGSGEPDAGRLPVWLAGPVVGRAVTRRLVVVLGAGRARPERGATATGGSRSTRGRRRAPGAAVLAGRLVVEVPGSSAALDRAMDAEPGTPAASRPSPRRSTARLTPTRRSTSSSTRTSSTGCGRPGPRSCSATRLSTSPPRPRASDDRAVAARGLRRLRRPARRRPAGHHRRPARSSARCAATGSPRRCPGQAEFDTGTTHLGATYESAWLACVLLADRGGERALVGFYDAVASRRSARDGPAAGLRAQRGRADPDWQQRLKELSG